MSEVLLAVGLLVSGNRQLVASYPDSWSRLGVDKLAGAPLPDIYLLVLALLLWYVLEHTRVGRYLFAIGGNVEARAPLGRAHRPHGLGLRRDR
jgi:ribose transport system permease protein